MISPIGICRFIVLACLGCSSANGFPQTAQEFPSAWNPIEFDGGIELITTMADTLWDVEAKVKPAPKVVGQFDTLHGTVSGVRFRFDRVPPRTMYIASTPNNPLVRISYDGSEYFEGYWKIYCSNDSMSDARECNIYQGYLTLKVFSDQRIAVFVGWDNFPNSSIAIRIDSDKPISVPVVTNNSFGFRLSKRIVEMMKSGSKIRTRYMEWPYQTYLDEEFELFGFEQALSYALWEVSQVRE